MDLKSGIQSLDSANLKIKREKGSLSINVHFIVTGMQKAAIVKWRLQIGYVKSTSFYSRFSFSRHYKVI